MAEGDASSRLGAFLAGATRRIKFGAILQTGGAAAFAQALVLASLPIVSRIFDEEAFGVLGLVITLSNILVLVSHFGFIDAIMAADGDEDADDILRLISTLTILGAALNLLLVTAVIRFDILGYGKLPVWTTGFVVAHAAAVAIAFAFQQRLIRAQRYRALAASHLALGIGRSSGQVGMGFTVPTPVGLVTAELFSRAAMALFVLSRTPLTIFNFTGRWQNMLRVAHEFRGFAAVRCGGILLNTLNLALPTLIVARYFSLVEVGIISFTLSVVYAPIGLIQKAIGDVFMGTYRSALATSRREASLVFWQMGGLLSVVGLLAGATLYYLGDVVFTFVFGEKWALAGVTAALLSPMIALMTVVVPLSSIVNIRRKPGIVLVFNIVRLALLTGVFVLVPILDLNYLWTVFAVSALSSLAYLGFGLAVIHLNAQPVANRAQR